MMLLALEDDMKDPPSGRGRDGVAWTWWLLQAPPWEAELLAAERGR